MHLVDFFLEMKKFDHNKIHDVWVMVLTVWFHEHLTLNQVNNAGTETKISFQYFVEFPF